MARIFALVCAFAVLLQTGFCLECCINSESNCKGNYMSCKENEVCVSVFVKLETMDPVIMERKCAPRALCNQSFSYIDGDHIQRWTASCCDMDKCNPSAPTYKGNALSCKSCSIGKSSQCQATTIQCSGNEDKCFSFSLENKLVSRGCASSNLCDVDLQGTIVFASLNKGRAKCTAKGGDDAESSASAVVPYSIVSLASMIFVLHWK